MSIEDLAMLGPPPQPIEITCGICREVYTVTVAPDDLYDWRHGKFAQDAFPYLSAAERELLISRTCGSCFDRMFALGT